MSIVSRNLPENLPEQSTRPASSVRSLWLISLMAGVVATGVDFLIATIATPLVHAPAGYPSFTWLPLLSGCMLGSIGGASTYLLLTRTVARPRKAFLCVAVGVLLASYVLPILPILNPLPRFAGVNWAIAFTLMGIHTVTAIIIVGSLLLWRPATPRIQN